MKRSHTAACPSPFPEYACGYAKRLAERSPGFAMQVSSAGEKPFSAAPPPDEADPFGETSGEGLPRGLVRRFADRVLVKTTNACFMHCRHCTRRWLLRDGATVSTPAAIEACVRYVESHGEIRDVLLSGGDVLTLPDDKVMEFVDAFASLGQIDIVRVCTRAPCANPARITRKLAKALGKSGKVWVNTQFNCVDEVTPEAHRAAKILVEAGIPVGCQTVLLKGVNDSTEQLLALFRALTAARIRPYYVFSCDPVAGTERFRVPLAKARRMERECAESIGGLSMPRFVRDLPGAKRKIPL